MRTKFGNIIGVAGVLLFAFLLIHKAAMYGKQWEFDSHGAMVPLLKDDGVTFRDGTPADYVTIASKDSSLNAIAPWVLVASVVSVPVFATMSWLMLAPRRRKLKQQIEDFRRKHPEMFRQEPRR